MFAILAKILTGPLVSAITGVVSKYIDAKTDREALHTEVEKAILETLGKATDAQAGVIKAEINSEERLARLWRPIANLSFVFILVFYSIVVPIAVGWFGAPPIRIGDRLLEWIYLLLASCIGVSTAGRSLEKISDMITRRWR